jgi:hypothetical protein
VSQLVTVFGRAILGQAASELLKQVVSVFVSARSRILSQAVTVFGPIQSLPKKLQSSLPTVKQIEAELAVELRQPKEL